MERDDTNTFVNADIDLLVIALFRTDVASQVEQEQRKGRR